jgi:hypothetical protein
MLSNKLILVMVALIVSLSTNVIKPNKVYFIDDDSLQILNGKVKQMTSAPVDDIYSTNPGQDYDIVDLNEKGDVTTNVHGFHGSVFKTYFITEYDPDGYKLETKGYIKLSDGLGFKSSFIKASSDTTKKLTLIYRYNKQNEVINYVVSPNKPNADSSTYKYDNEGKLIELDHYTYSKFLMDVTRCKYDKNNNAAEIDVFHWKRLMTKTLYNYTKIDANNNWTEATIHFE